MSLDNVNKMIRDMKETQDLVNDLLAKNIELKAKNDELNKTIKMLTDNVKNISPYSVMLLTEIIEWRKEIDADTAVQYDLLKVRVETEDASNMGLQLSRVDLAGQINKLEAISITLGQIIRGNRL